MTVSVSQNNSRVIEIPSTDYRPVPAGRSGYSQSRLIALRTDAHIGARRVLNRWIGLAAHTARRNLFRIELGQPFAPVRPPRTLVLLSTLDPVLQRNVLDLFVGPILVFTGGGWIDDAGDVTGTGQHILHRAAE